MAEEQHHASNPDLDRLHDKTQKGAKNVVTDILKDPVIQDMIKKSVLKETTTSGLVMACLFFGLFKTYEVAKTVLKFDWTIDLLVALVLLVFSLSYTVNKFKPKKQ